MKVLTVIGNRPQFVKAAAVSTKLRERAEEVLVQRRYRLSRRGFLEHLLGQVITAISTHRKATVADDR